MKTKFGRSAAIPHAASSDQAPPQPAISHDNLFTITSPKTETRDQTPRLYDAPPAEDMRSRFSYVISNSIQPGSPARQKSARIDKRPHLPLPASRLLISL